MACDRQFQFGMTYVFHPIEARVTETEKKTDFFVLLPHKCKKKAINPSFYFIYYKALIPKERIKHCND